MENVIEGSLTDLQEKKALGLLTEDEADLLDQLDIQAQAQQAQVSNKAKGAQQSALVAKFKGSRRFIRVNVEDVNLKSFSIQTVYNALVEAGIVALNTEGQTDYKPFVQFTHAKGEKRTSSNVVSVFVDREGKNFR